MKWFLVGVDGFKFFPHGREHAVIETTTRLTDMNQIPVLVIEAQHNRAEELAASLRFGVAGNHSFESMLDFHLQPFTAAAGFVEAVASFREDAFQTLAAGYFEESLAVRDEMVRKANGVARRDKQVCECGFAVLERDAAQVVTVEVKEVEGVVKNLNILVSSDSPAALAESGALLHKAERRAPVLI